MSSSFLDIQLRFSYIQLTLKRGLVKFFFKGGNHDPKAPNAARQPAVDARPRAQHARAGCRTSSATIRGPAGKRARNYRMLPKVWREAAERHEGWRSAPMRRAPTPPRPPLRPRDRGLPHGAASDLLRQPSGQDHLMKQDGGDGGPPLRSGGLPDRARGGPVRQRQDHLLPAAPAAGPPQGPGGDLRAGHGPDQGGVSQGVPQRRASRGAST